MEKTYQVARENAEYITAMRRDFHMHPEPSKEEFRTCERIVEELRGMGLEPRVVAVTGVVCDIRGDRPGKTIGLRADHDALSVQELNEVPYKSKLDGMMHACGHDGHAASLLGAARVLLACRDQIRGTVRLLFQPGEEIGYGAKAMIKEGCLEGVDATFAIHLASGIPTGQVDVAAGPKSAAASMFGYRLVGGPGHGASPHQGVDAGLCMSACVLNLQSVVSREFDPMEPLVLTVGKLNSGTRWNVIASEATFEGTVRTYNPKTFKKVPEAMDRIVNETAAAYRCQAERLFYEELTVPVVNPEQATARARRTVEKLLGESAVVSRPASAGGEDYSFMMEAVADSILCNMGSGNPDKDSCHPHHSGRFDIDEEALVNSAAMYAQYSIDFLSE
ncbi:MAG: amidohydrolase [Clostridiales bacterium]|nr:amidohydrolase [Clostridiales bacterium]